MRINARLDEAHARKLGFLKRATLAGVSEIVKQAIDLYFDHVSRSQVRAHEVLSASGFIGSGQASSDLSEAYKKDLAEILASKHDHR